jgi:hypothetical protein
VVVAPSSRKNPAGADVIRDTETYYVYTPGEKPNALLCIATVLGWLFVGRRSSD